MTRNYVRHSLTSNELGVLEALETRGGTLKISVPRFASLVGCSEPTLRGSVRRLVGWGLVGRRENVRDDGGCVESTYSLTLLALSVRPWGDLNPQDLREGLRPALPRFTAGSHCL